jgi:hypothetical protein
MVRGCSALRLGRDQLVGVESAVSVVAGSQTVGMNRAAKATQIQLVPALWTQLAV